MSRVFIIAEAGVNHNGSESIAKELVEIAAKCGADAVKFQTFSADNLVLKGTAKAGYQMLRTGNGDQHTMLKTLELSHAAHRNLAAACELHGIDFMSTPFDESAVDMLLTLGMQRLKVASGEITNLPLLRFLASKCLPIIISTGMAEMSEIHCAVRAVREVWRAIGYQPTENDLTILHCTSNYPAEFRDVNLRAMQTIKSEIGVPVGYSDHTPGIAVPIAAVAMGATVIEKHFTINKGMTGPDHSASLDPAELKAMVVSIRAVEQCLGSAIKAPATSELPIRSLVRRSVTLLRDIEAGETVDREDVALLRPGTGIAPVDLERVAGRQLRHALSAGTTLFWSDFE